MKKSSLFIIISCLFLSFLLAFYGYRFFKYRKEAKQLEKVGETNLNSIIESKSYDPSFILDNKDIYYNETALNNYVYYSNRYFRIIGLVNNHLILVDDISTILPFENNFESSDIYTWLNDKEKGVYYKTLYDYENQLDETLTCLDIDCNSYSKSLIGLISPYLYNKLNNSYLNNNNFYWLSDGSYVNQEGNIIEHDEGIYGVRAVITLKEDVLYYGGTGTYFDPYFITLEDYFTFNNIEKDIVKVGSYLTYSNKVWRVIDTSSDIKVVLDDTIGNFSYSKDYNEFNIENKNSIAYYLNHTFYNTLDKTYLKEGIFNIGTYQNSYLDIFTETVSTYVGMLSIGDMFLNDSSNYFTLTNTGLKNTVFKVMNGMLYADHFENKNKIKPVIYLDKNIPIKDGFGTKDAPFVVGEV